MIKNFTTPEEKQRKGKTCNTYLILQPFNNKKHNNIGL
jgi:hypothetical protein